jgi:hypothetical protein
MGYESALFNQSSGNEITVKIQSGLGIGKSGEVIPWRRKANINSIDCSRICSVISAYRLLDVVAITSGAELAPIVERCFFNVPNTSFRVSAVILTSSPLKCIQGMDKLANWPAVLEQFRTTVTKSKKTVQLTPQDKYGPFNLLRLIARNNTTKIYTAIEANFLYTAMHIACMKELRFPNEVCPDLPDNLDSLLRG